MFSRPKDEKRSLFVSHLSDAEILHQLKLEPEKKLLVVDAKSCKCHQRNPGRSTDQRGYYYSIQT